MRTYRQVSAGARAGFIGTAAVSMMLTAVFMGNSIAYADTSLVEAGDAVEILTSVAPPSDSGPAGTSGELADAESIQIEGGEVSVVGPADLGASQFFGLSLPEIPATQTASVRSGEASVFLDPDSKVDVVVEPLQGGVRIATVLADRNAPTTFSYGLPEGTSSTMNLDGSVTLTVAAGTVLPGTTVQTTQETPVGTIGAAWAFDANGKAVPTSYTISDGQLIQKIDVSSSSVTFPVTADPSYWWGWNYFISNANVTKIIKIVTAVGATAGTVAWGLQKIGLSRLAAIAGAAAVLLGLGAALANVCNINSRGILIGNSWALNLALGFTPLIATGGGNFCLSQ